MGRYLNPSNEGFARALRSEIYIDKTGMIGKLNQLIGTNEPLVCVSRPRRFGKSVTANMLVAYYSKGANSDEMFRGLQIARDNSYRKHLNQYNVLLLDMQSLTGKALTAVRYGKEKFVFQFVQRQVIADLIRAYPAVVHADAYSLPETLQSIHAETGEKFIIIIDEWDCIFRNEKYNDRLQTEYIEFLRELFKGIEAEACIDLAYITGILPIKKYGTESALNNFMEITMTDSKWFGSYVGFTMPEVSGLCSRYEMDFEEMQRWYDGYLLGTGKNTERIYSPRSVVEAVLSGKMGNYWTGTETYESLKSYIVMNFDGLKDAVAYLLAGQKITVNTAKFQNDMVSMDSRDDVLSLLVHLGYLGYDEESRTVFIPNEEVKQEFVNAVEDTGWTELVRAIDRSRKLLEATWNQDAAFVAAELERVHEENVSILNYNDENALAFVVSIAYISARADYVMYRELPAGKGFADMALFPRKYFRGPAILIELKWDKSAESAIDQIRRKKYMEGLDQYKDNLLLVGINYDKKTKIHQCIIEKAEK